MTGEGASKGRLPETKDSRLAGSMAFEWASSAMTLCRYEGGSSKQGKAD